MPPTDAADGTVDVLVPTADRPAGLAVTLTGLLGADHGRVHRLVVADQTAGSPSYDAAEAAAVLRVLRHRGWQVDLHHRPQRRGVAEQRAFLLGRAQAASALFLDDDVLLETGALTHLREALAELDCGLVGMAPQGLSYAGDVRPHEHEAFEPWEGPVLPERVRKATPAWGRWQLHNAANLVHLAGRHPTPQCGWTAYKVAWIGGCVLYRTAALRSIGGYDFWAQLPAQQRGEDVVAQLRVIERSGGAGLLPSLAHHLELPTTLPERTADAYALVLDREDRRVLAVPGGPAGAQPLGEAIRQPAH